MNLFQGIDHLQQRLYIHWDITTKCNYHCNYCYSWQDYEKNNKWNQETTKDKIFKILKSIELSSLPVFLGLLGGEPTISKYYFDILSYIENKILPKHESNRLYITTNLSKKLDWWRDHPKIKNTFILASFHPEYFKDNEEILNFIIKLRYLSKYFKVKLNIMLDPKHQNALNILYDFLPDLENKVIIHPHIIYPNGSPFEDIRKIYKNNLKKFKKFFDYQKPEYIFNNQELTDYEVFDKKLNQFQGWKCWQNNYEISLNGIVQNLCFDENDDLTKNLFFFKNIKNIKPRVCSKQWCSCDGLLKCKKIK